MTDEEIRARRKALKRKETAIRELLKLEDISYDEYSQQRAKIQIERRKLKPVKNTVSDSSSRLPMVGPSSDGPSRWSEEWWASVSPETQSKRCKAHNTRGLRCQRISIEYGTVCYTHGGAAPQIKKAARARLENATYDAAGRLISLGVNADSEVVRLKANTEILDRGGLKAPSEVVLSQGNSFDEVFGDISKMTRAESRAARGYSADSADSAEPLDADFEDYSAPQLPAMKDSDSNCVDSQQDSNCVDSQQDSNCVDSQGDSNTQYDSRADLDDRARADLGERRYAYPAATQSHDDHGPNTKHRMGHDRPPAALSGPAIEGYAALEAANAANAANRATGALRPVRRR